ncbi:MAG: ATP-binding protein [Stenotrophobium sp.]
MRGGLYVRLFLWFFIANVLTLTFSILLTERIAHRVYANLQLDWNALGEESAALYAGGGTTALSLWAEQLQHRGIDIALMENGHNLLERPLPEAIRAHLQELNASNSVVLHPTSEQTLASVVAGAPQGRKWRFLAVRDPHSPPPFRLLLPLSVEVLLSLVVIALVGWRVSRGIAKPVAAVQDAARRMAQGDLSARVGAPLSLSSDELGQLARDFDHMAGRIEALVDHMRVLLQDVSHELRSPLARLQLALELARGGSAENGAQHFARAEREVARLDRIIAEMLALARLEAKLPERMDETVDLHELAAERIADLRSQTDTVNVSLLGAASPPILVRGQRALLSRALNNLLSNAVKYGGTAGKIDVRVAREGQDALIEVADRGRGVIEAELPQLFRLYFRGSNAGDIEGQGLGLAIVERIARAHGGRCAAANRKGGGLAVTLRIPTIGSAPVSS